MKKNYLYILSLALILLLITAAALKLRKPEVINPLTFQVESEGISRKITLWEQGDNAYGFFPSYADPKHITLHPAPGCRVTVDGTPVHSGDALDSFLFDTPYTMTADGKTQTLIFLKSENLPAMYLDTNSGNMDFLSESKENKEAGFMQLVQSDGQILFRGKLPAVSGRGNHSWMLEKKGWSITLPEPEGLLGMNRSANWVLLANAYEASHGLRNYIAYKMALETGMEYARDLHFVDLYLNGEYAGMYQLVERIEVTPDALDIGDLDRANASANRVTSLDPDVLNVQKIKREDGYIRKSWADMVSPPDITGGYLLEHNYDYKLLHRLFQFSTQQSDSFVVRYPSALSLEEADYISSLFQSVENALFSDDFLDPQTGKELTELIDLDSWVRKFLVDEVTKNEGAGSTSSYYYKKQGDDLIYAGPVWDYDKSMGTIVPFDRPDGLTLSSMHPSYPTFWIRQLYDHPEVLPLTVKYYCELYRPYLEKMLASGLDQIADYIHSSYRMDWARWEHAYLSYPIIAYQCNNNPGSLDSSVEFLRDWVSRRMDFLDQVWVEQRVFHVININYGSAYENAVISIPEGTAPDQVPGWPEGEFFDVTHLTPFDGSSPLKDSATLITLERYNAYLEQDNKDTGQVSRSFPVLGVTQLLIYSSIAASAILFICIRITDFRRSSIRKGRKK